MMLCSNKQMNMNLIHCQLIFVQLVVLHLLLSPFYLKKIIDICSTSKNDALSAHLDGHLVVLNQRIVPVSR